MAENISISRVGMLGLGHMGHPMALHLLESPLTKKVNITGRHREKLTALEDAGATWQESAKDVALNSDVILSVLPDLAELESLLEGPEGLLAGIDHPVVLLICSTSSPQGVRDLAAKLDAQADGNIKVMDAPLSGGADGAQEGTLSIMMGGEKTLYDQVSPLLKACGTPIYMGELGAGEVTKACNQMIVAATITTLSEASIIAERAGIDLEQLFKALAGGYAGSRLMESRKSRLIQKDYKVSGAAKFLLKDLTFAMTEGGKHHVHTPQLNTLHTIFADIAKSPLGEDDLSVVQHWIETQSTP